MRVKDQELRAIFERYGYDPDDPARGLDVPDRLLRALAGTRFMPPTEKFERQPLKLLPPSQRELETLELVACGLGYKEIAVRQVVSAETVQSRLKAVYRKLGARNAAHAVALAIAQRLIPLR